MDQALTRDGWELWVSKIRELADEAPVVTILEILGNKLYRLSLGG